MREMLRDCLKLAADAAAGAAGEFRRRAESGARELVELSGLDPEQLRAKVPASVQSLAEEIVGAGRTNSELLIGLVRSEAEKAWSRLGDGMVHVGVVLELLERQVRALQGGEEETTPSAAEAKPGPEPKSEPESKSKPVSRAEQAFPGRAPRPVRVVVDPEDGAASAAAAAAARRRAAVPGMRKVAEGRGAAASAKPTRSAKPTEVAEPAPARKTAAKKAPAKTAPAKTAPAKQAAPKKTAAKKTAAKKTAAKKTAAKKSVAKKSVAKKSTAEQAPAKTATTKKTAAKKTAATQTTAKKTVAGKTAAKKQTTARKAPARKPRQAQESATDE